MPARRLSGSDRRDQQLLLRLTREEMDILESAAHLEHKTPNSYAHELLQAHVRVLAVNPYVAADRANRRAYAQATSGAAAIPMSRTRTDSTDDLMDGHGSR